MRSEGDARPLASMSLPSDKWAFVQSADTAELWTPEGWLIRFAEGYTVAGAERAAGDYLHLREMLRDLETLPPEANEYFLLAEIREFEERLGFADEGFAAAYEDATAREHQGARNTSDGLPHLTQELQDQLTELGWRRKALFGEEGAENA